MRSGYRLAHTQRKPIKRGLCMTVGSRLRGTRVGNLAAVLRQTAMDFYVDCRENGMTKAFARDGASSQGGHGRQFFWGCSKSFKNCFARCGASCQGSLCIRRRLWEGWPGRLSGRPPAACLRMIKATKNTGGYRRWGAGAGGQHWAAARSWVSGLLCKGETQAQQDCCARERAGMGPCQGGKV